jgi:hypothetical protein
VPILPKVTNKKFPLVQGCQIFLDTTYQNRKNIPK